MDMHTPTYAEVMGFQEEKEEGYNCVSPEDPSIAFVPGPADISERFMWIKDCEDHLQKRPSLRFRQQQEGGKLKTLRQPQLDHSKIVSRQVM